MSSGLKTKYCLTFFVLVFWAALGSSINAFALADQDPKTNSDPKAMGKKPSTEGIAPTHFVSWEACIAAAELGRSDRDLKFFLSASNLSDAKAWFVSHSRANEARFCSEVLICEQAFGNLYSDFPSSYPSC